MPWAENSGGTIRLDEPLSIQELQTGALVLRVRLNGGEDEDCIGIPVVNGSELIGIDFVCRGIVVYQFDAYTSAWRDGVFVVHQHDRAQNRTWQIVGARIDRQYWHGGRINAGGIVGTADETTVIGSPAVPVVAREDVGTGLMEISVGSASPIGGQYMTGGLLTIYSGSENILSGEPIILNSVPTSASRQVVKGVIFTDSVSGRLDLLVLYPYYNPLSDYYKFALVSSDGSIVTRETRGPWDLTVRG